MINLDDLRRANIARLPEFKNSKGEPAHSKPDGSDWSLGEWISACLGELGEAANLIKKIRRGDISLEESKVALSDELADTIIYLDILAYQAGIDLGQAVISKFNRTSVKVDSSIALQPSRRYWYLATPYALYPDGKEAAFQVALEQTAQLMKSGIGIFSPIVHNHRLSILLPEHEGSFDFWVTQVDLAMMEGALGCIACLLPSWSKSRGMKHEIEWFAQRDRTVAVVAPRNSSPHRYYRGPGVYETIIATEKDS